MSGIILQATAFKITNKGGGIKQSIKDGQVDWTRDTGSDYVHFNCPKCKHRNKASMYESEPYHDPKNDRIPFKCRMCRTVIEVTRPVTTGKSLLLTPEQFSQEMAERRQAIREGRLAT